MYREAAAAPGRYRWTVGAYPGSRADKVQALVGLHDVGVVMMNKRIRWAASVYARKVPELRVIAEPILKEAIGEEVELRWVVGVSNEERQVQVEELEVERVEEWSDGSRADGRAAGATRQKGLYLSE